MTQCEAITQAGHQCKHGSTGETEFCWQHERMYYPDDDNCQATTQKGHQCSRKATHGNYCWQHDEIKRKEKSVVVKQKKAKEENNDKEIIKKQQKQIDKLIKQNSDLTEKLDDLMEQMKTSMVLTQEKDKTRKKHIQKLDRMIKSIDE